MSISGTKRFYAYKQKEKYLFVLFVLNIPTFSEAKDRFILQFIETLDREKIIWEEKRIRELTRFPEINNDLIFHRHQIGLYFFSIVLQVKMYFCRSKSIKQKTIKNLDNPDAEKRKVLKENGKTTLIFLESLNKFFFSFLRFLVQTFFTFSHLKITNIWMLEKYMLKASGN